MRCLIFSKHISCWSKRSPTLRVNVLSKSHNTELRGNGELDMWLFLPKLMYFKSLREHTGITCQQTTYKVESVILEKDYWYWNLTPPTPRFTIPLSPTAFPFIRSWHFLSPVHKHRFLLFTNYRAMTGLTLHFSSAQTDWKYPNYLRTKNRLLCFC